MSNASWRWSRSPGTGEKRVEALRLADIFRARPVDTTTASFIFEITGPPDKIDSFIALMRELGLVEVGRTGIVGMMRGAGERLATISHQSSSRRRPGSRQQRANGWIPAFAGMTA